MTSWTCPTEHDANQLARALQDRGMAATVDGVTVTAELTQGLQRAAAAAAASRHGGQRTS